MTVRLPIKEYTIKTLLQEFLSRLHLNRKQVEILGYNGSYLIDFIEIDKIEKTIPLNVFDMLERSTPNHIKLHTVKKILHEHFGVVYKMNSTYYENEQKMRSFKMDEQKLVAKKYEAILLDAIGEDNKINLSECEYFAKRLGKHMRDDGIEDPEEFLKKFSGVFMYIFTGTFVKHNGKQSEAQKAKEYFFKERVRWFSERFNEAVLLGWIVGSGLNEKLADFEEKKFTFEEILPMITNPCAISDTSINRYIKRAIKVFGSNGGLVKRDVENLVRHIDEDTIEDAFENRSLSWRLK